MADERGRSVLREHDEKYRKLLEHLTIMDDIFMRNVLNRPECAEHVLRTVLGQPELKVMECIVQKDYKNLQGRSASLDCVIRDAENRRYDLEIQQDNEEAPPERARYYSGLMDMNTLEAGQDFRDLPEATVIFITKKDILGDGLPVYHMERLVCETGKEFGDRSHIIYVNSEIQDDTELGCLMHDLHCKKADDMYSGVLAERVRVLKETPEGVEHMCRAMDELYNEGVEFGKEQGIELGKEQGIELGKEQGIAIGEARGKEQGIAIGERSMKKEIALSLAEMGTSVENIAQAVKESVSRVRRWIEEDGVLTR